MKPRVRAPGAARLRNKRSVVVQDQVSAVPVLDAFWLGQGPRSDAECDLMMKAMSGRNDTDVLEAGSGPFGAISVRWILN